MSYTERKESDFEKSVMRKQDKIQIEGVDPCDGNLCGQMKEMALQEIKYAILS